MSTLRPQSYVLSALLVTVLSWALAGCRFGNRVEVGGPPDGWSGQYEMALASHRRCVLLDGNQGAICETEEASRIPAVIQTIFASPTSFQLVRPGESDAYFIATSDPTKGLPTRIDLGSARLQYEQELSEGDAPLWTAGDCSYYEHMFQAGTVHKRNKTGILGRIDLELALQTGFTGSQCGLVLQVMSECILDLAKCEPSDEVNTRELLQAYARSWFERYRELGLIEYADIPSILAMGTVISYH